MSYKPSRFGSTPPDWFGWIIWAGVILGLGKLAWEFLQEWVKWG